MQKPILVSKSTFDASLSETIRKNMTKKNTKNVKKVLKKLVNLQKILLYKNDNYTIFSSRKILEKNFF